MKNRWELVRRSKNKLFFQSVLNCLNYAAYVKLIHQKYICTRINNHIVNQTNNSGVQFDRELVT